MTSTESLQRLVADWYDEFEAGEVDGPEPYVATDPDYPDIIMYVEFSDERGLIENSDYEEEVLDARWDDRAQTEAEGMWRQ